MMSYKDCDMKNKPTWVSDNHYLIFLAGFTCSIR